jgi:hypothetical protein
MQTEIEAQATNDYGPSALKALPEQEDVLIAAAQVPEYIGLKAQTLARWRCEGVGPVWCALGRRIFYRSSDLRDWIKSRVRRNTIASI